MNNEKKCAQHGYLLYEPVHGKWYKLAFEKSVSSDQQVHWAQLLLLTDMITHRPSVSNYSSNIFSFTTRSIPLKICINYPDINCPLPKQLK